MSASTGPEALPKSTSRPRGCTQSSDFMKVSLPTESYATGTFFPFVISTLLWLNNSTRVVREARNGLLVNIILGAALALYVYLAVLSVLERIG